MKCLHCGKKYKDTFSVCPYCKTPSGDTSPYIPGESSVKALEPDTAPNPYRQGQIQEDIEENSGLVNRTKLWNPKIFILISVIFSFLPAAILYSLNYGRLGNAKKRNTYLIAFTLMFLLTITLGFLSANTFMKSLIYGLNIGIGAYMQNDQLKLYKNHIQNGGKKASFIVPVIICIVVSAIVILGMLLSRNIPDQKQKFYDDELYYTNNVSIDDVNKLGKYLEENEFFANDNKTVSVKLDKKSDTYIFSMIVTKEYINDKDYLDSLKDFTKQLSNDLFKSKVELDICDNTFKPLKVIKS